MKIGFLGLGKLGLPVALAVESKGHTVIGTDINETTLKNIRSKNLNYREEGAEELLRLSKLQLKSLGKIVEESDIIFVPIVAFDNRLYRIGYGGGYYDRYIQKLSNKKKLFKVGIAHSCQKINKIPINKYDKKLDIIITEK